jgi:hypothetical protein
MAVIGSFDTDGLRQAGQRITSAASSLDDLTSALRMMPGGSLPSVVQDALSQLNSHGHDMISDIHTEAGGLADALGKVADAYDAVEHSIFIAFMVQTA